MHMSIRQIAPFVLTCMIVLCATGSVAQEDDLQFELEDVQMRKEPGFFRRPEKNSAGEQLEYAAGLRAKGRTRKAAKEYRALVHQWHDSPEAAAAQQAYAELLMQQGKYTKAFDEFQYLIDFFAGEFDYDEVLDRQFKIANTVMTRRRCRMFFLPGFTSPERALPLFEQIVKNAPDWRETPRAQFNIGLIKETALNDFAGAVEAYAVVTTCYSDSEYAAGAAFRRAYCMYMISNKTPRDEAGCRRAFAAISGFLRDYHGDPNEKKAIAYREELRKRLEKLYYDIAVFYDKKADRPEAAVIAYSDFIRKFPSSSLAVEAEQRMKELEKTVDSGQ